MLFSATLSSNPQQLAALNLKNPKFYSIVSAKKLQRGIGENASRADHSASKQEGHSLSDEEEAAEAMVLPKTLEECYVRVGRTATKPLVLLALLHRLLEQSGDQSQEDDREEEEEEEEDEELEKEAERARKKLVVIFTSSVDSTHRLCRLLQLVPGLRVTAKNRSGKRSDATEGAEVARTTRSVPVAEFSSLLSAGARASLTRACARGAVQVVVCSDGMARGVDLPSVTAVVNYDLPPFVMTYVHRVGRTARAGKKGSAYTLVKGKSQEKKFFDMRSKLSSRGVARHLRVSTEECDAVRADYARSLGALKEVMEEEAQNELKPLEKIRRLPPA